MTATTGREYAAFCSVVNKGKCPVIEHTNCPVVAGKYEVAFLCEMTTSFPW